MSEMNDRKRELQELIAARKRKSQSPETGGVTGDLEGEKALVPETFAEKWSNFWYHYKFIMLGFVLVVAVLVGIFWSALFPKRYDATLTIVSEFRFEGIQDRLAADMAQIAGDLDKNGEKQVELVPFWMSSNPDETVIDKQLYVTGIQKLAVWPTSNDHFLYLLDDTSYAYLTDLGLSFMDLSDKIPGENVKGDKYYIKGTKLEEFFYLDGSETDYEMYFCFIDYSRFPDKVQGKSKVRRAYENDWAFFEKLLAENNGE